MVPSSTSQLTFMYRRNRFKDEGVRKNLKRQLLKPREMVEIVTRMCTPTLTLC